jgi:hypothetical protein
MHVNNCCRLMAFLACSVPCARRSGRLHPDTPSAHFSRLSTAADPSGLGSGLCAHAGGFSGDMKTIGGGKSTASPTCSLPTTRWGSFPVGSTHKAFATVSRGWPKDSKRPGCSPLKPITSRCSSPRVCIETPTAAIHAGAFRERSLRLSGQQCGLFAVDIFFCNPACVQNAAGPQLE